MKMVRHSHFDADTLTLAPSTVTTDPPTGILYKSLMQFMTDRLLFSKPITISLLGTQAAARSFNWTELTVKSPVSDGQNTVNTSAKLFFHVL